MIMFNHSRIYAAFLLVTYVQKKKKKKKSLSSVIKIAGQFAQVAASYSISSVIADPFHAQTIL